MGDARDDAPELGPPGSPPRQPDCRAAGRARSPPRRSRLPWRFIERPATESRLNALADSGFSLEDLARLQNLTGTLQLL
eukprot:5409523-Alexandrium_andersonii.AAC.1